jgi:hypothetical protein
MELKTKSWYVWLYNYTYNSKLPENLCPFFWKLVTAIILFIPNLILRLPVSIVNMITKDGFHKGDGRTGIGIIIYTIVTIIIFYIIGIYHYILWALNFDNYNSTLATLGGIISIIICILIIREIWIKKNVKYTLEDKISNNIIVNYCKSWYKNYCPKINWK